MTSILIRYFAAAAQAAGTEEEHWPTVTTLAELRAGLQEKYGQEMAKVLNAGSFLVNGTVRRDTGALRTAGDETDGKPLTVDVLPPFAGG
ncbi:MoaD/ThiS family protein [Arthrobacter sp. MYb211]|uniref:MoaD/ThiS family protein n=1 Tax=Micrococcaceae TaxID=1268 RepID=UPI000BB93ADD|nr:MULTISPECIES: MoaD/ThiS family protein [Micrococcaceae]PCC28782.1 molybdopterin synthase sulfur carrier subunit [Glutamicibacter sp. BW80]PQZ98663.1 MoaD/ThiS family protein [Arthrobacter sp. MYb224]PRA11040.1 MoaD/ThiS family protein [Arthrobacter sp. MYb221]PRC07195.1 MoaD/ThiS family protein [Arthrobacter sp. MYb211]